MYATTAQMEAYLNMPADPDLGALLSDLLERASRAIDLYTGRWFEARTQTHQFDAVGRHISGQMLLVDVDLLSITTLTNGDGSTIPLADVTLRPRWQPYFGIELAEGRSWTYSGSPTQAITVEGTWGYSATPPEPIVHATLRLAGWMFRQRDTHEEGLVMSDQGAVFAASHMPRDVRDLLRPYIKVGF